MEEQQNSEDMIDSLVRPERLSRVISQSPQYVRDDIKHLVEGEQIPGSFGDLIKRSVEITEAHKAFEGTNVVSIFGKAVAR
jgi:hypothetical protein